MNTNTLKSRLCLFIASATLSAVLSGCGSSGVQENAAAVAQTDAAAAVAIPTLNPNYAAYNHYFETCGLQPSDISGLVQADNVLNIRVRSETAPQNGCYPNTTTNIPYQARYTCSRYKVIVQVKTGPNLQTSTMASGDAWMDLATFKTGLLSTPGTDGCTGSKSEEIYNIMPYLFAGHGLVRFKMEAAESNHFCNQYNFCQQPANYWTYDCAGYRNMSSASVCPYKPVYQYHKVAGQIDVQSDGGVL